MKSLKYVFLFIIGSLYLTACKDIETLNRDNPLDGNSPNAEAKIVYNSYNIYSINNSSRIISPGTRVALSISLKNIGTGAANGVKATFSTISSDIDHLYYVDGLHQNEIFYGYMPANTVRWSGEVGGPSAIEFTVSNTTPKDTQIPININIVDDKGNTWIDSFYVLVQ